MYICIVNPLRLCVVSHFEKRTPTQRQLAGRCEEAKVGMTLPYQKPPKAHGIRGWFYR